MSRRLLNLQVWRALGRWLARLCGGRLPRWMHTAEKPLYRLAGTDPEQSMPWTQYSLALLAFNAVGVLAVYAILTQQDIGKLFMAGIVPGLLAMGMYVITIFSLWRSHKSNQVAIRSRRSQQEVSQSNQ